MMSYLWILLLSSLLATGAKAQDDLAPPEENVATEAPVPAAAVPEDDGEPGEETDDMTKDIPPTTSASEPDAEVAPAGGDTEPAATADDTTEPAAPADDKTEQAAHEEDKTEPEVPEEDKTEPAVPAGDITEPAAPEEDKTEPTPPTEDIKEPEATEEDKTEPAATAEDTTRPAAPVEDETEPAATAEVPTEPEATEEVKTEPAASADDITEPEATEEDKTEPATTAAGEEEPGTTAAGDTEAAATTAEPAADPETEQPAVDVEEETTADPDTTSAPVPNGHDDVAQAGTDVADDKEEEPTEIANNTNSISIVEEIIVPKGRTGVHAQFPTGNEEIAAPEVNAAHVAGSSANDNQKTKEASSSSVAGIVCGIAVAAVGAVAGYFTYQKKKLCFKERQEADPEAARKADAAEAQSDPQVLSNLLNSS